MNNWIVLVGRNQCGSVDQDITVTMDFLPLMVIALVRILFLFCFSMKIFFYKNEIDSFIKYYYFYK
jgi:hypothetical protein